MTPRIQVKLVEHHGEPAFCVSGRDDGNRRVRIFVRKRETAERLRHAICEGAPDARISEIIMSESCSHRSRTRLVSPEAAAEVCEACRCILRRFEILQGGRA